MMIMNMHNNNSPTKC